MHIRKLEISLKDNRKLTYRFYPGAKDYRYTYGLNIPDQKERNSFIDACRYVFGISTEIPTAVEAVVLECYDDSGTIWTCIKGREGTFTLRDGEQVSRQNGSDPKIPNSREFFNKLNLDILSYEQGCFQGVTVANTHAENDRELRKLQIQQFEKLVSELGLTSAQGPKLWEQLANLENRLVKLQGNLGAWKQLARFEKQDLKGKNNIDEFRLRDQIHLLKKVESAFNQYQSAQRLAGKVKTLMNRNQQILSELPPEHANLCRHFNNFEDIFELARTYISAKIGEIHESNAANWFQIFADSMQPDFQQYLESLEKIILQGAHISSRIDMEIRNGVAASENVDQIKENTGLFNTSRFIFKRMLHQMKSIEESKQQFRKDLAFYLTDVSNLSLCLGEIRENMQTAESRLNSLRSDSLNIFKKTQSHFVDDMANWKHLAEDVQLAADLSPKEFFSFLSSCMLKIQVEAVTEHLDMNLSYLADSKNVLIESIKEWRHLSKSVDKTEMQDDTVLISEARRLVRYLHEKEELRRQLSEQRAELMTQQNFQKIRDELKAENEKLIEISELGLPNLTFNLESGLADETEDRVNTLLTRIHVLRKAREHAVLNQHERLQGLQAPFQIIMLNGLEKMDDLEKVLASLQASNTNPFFARILLADTKQEILDLTETSIGHVKQMSSTAIIDSDRASLKQAGLSDITISSRPIPTPTVQRSRNIPPSPNSNAVAKPSDQKPMHPLAARDKPLSEDAKRALEILTSKPRSRSSAVK